MSIAIENLQDIKGAWLEYFSLRNQYLHKILCN